MKAMVKVKAARLDNSFHRQLSAVQTHCEDKNYEFKGGRSK
jgi:hypothetical protein